MELKERCTKLCKCCKELEILKKNIREDFLIHIEGLEIKAISYQGEKYVKEDNISKEDKYDAKAHSGYY